MSIARSPKGKGAVVDLMPSSSNLDEVGKLIHFHFFGVAKLSKVDSHFFRRFQRGFQREALPQKSVQGLTAKMTKKTAN